MSAEVAKRSKLDALKRRVVFVFDYDFTIVSENSDVYIPESLNGKHAMSLIEEYSRDVGWTQLMDSVLVALQTKDGKTIDNIIEAAQDVPCFPEMLDILKHASKHGEVHVASDANSLFIESFFKRHGLKLDSLHTNPARLADGVLRIFPYSENEPHLCPRCPKNMCKGKIVREKVLRESDAHRPRVIYFGDGSNDFCPVVSAMTEDDILFAREDPDDLRARGLVKKLAAHSETIRPQVIKWQKGRDLLELLNAHVLHKL